MSGRSVNGVVLLQDEERQPLADDAQLAAAELEAAQEEPEYELTEEDPLKYPPAPPAYYRRGENVRTTNWVRLIVVLIAVAVACLSVAALIDVSSPPDGVDQGRDVRSVADSVLAAMDRSADPCNSFYEYACGSWERSSHIPPDRTQYSKSFSVVYDRIRLTIRKMLQGELQKAGNPHVKAGIFYASCMKSMGSGSLRIEPLLSFRDVFANFRDSDTFAKALATLHAVPAAGMFDIGVAVNERKPNEYALYLGQGGLGLPHRDKYWSTRDADIRIRARYIRLIQSMLYAGGRAQLVTRRNHEQLASQIFAFEKHIANVSLPPEDLRDPNKVYNPLKLSSFHAGMSIRTYLESAKIDAKAIDNTIIVDNVKYFTEIGKMMDRVNRDSTWRLTARAYLAFHLVRHMAADGLLGRDLYIKNYQFKRLVYGMKKMPETWKVCQSIVNNYLGDAVGAAFVEKHFSERSKAVAQRLSGEITKSFGDSLAHQTWMDGETRRAAKEKLDAIGWKLGYTSHFDKYEDVTITRRSFANNILNAAHHEWRKNLNKLGKPIDKTKWFMNAHEVNAYYSPTRNEMVFPAGILQQPFFSDAYPPAMNYGSIGAVIGHEMSHGFDDQGRKYDKNGRLTTWWSKQSAQKYDEKAKCYVKLYNTYKPRGVDIHVNGNLTLGENLADNNGVKVAFHAFKASGNASSADAAPPNAILAKEMTNHQLFFVAYAQTWCTLYRTAALRVQMKTDPHSPGQFRVLGPLSQNPDFAKAFKCRVGTRYNPASRCSLW